MTTTHVWHTLPSKLYNINSKSGRENNATRLHPPMAYELVRSATRDRSLEAGKTNGATCVFARSTIPSKLYNLKSRSGQENEATHLRSLHRIQAIYYNIKFSRTQHHRE